MEEHRRRERCKTKETQGEGYAPRVAVSLYRRQIPNHRHCPSNIPGNGWSQYRTPPREHCGPKMVRVAARWAVALLSESQRRDLNLSPVRCAFSCLDTRDGETFAFGELLGVKAEQAQGPRRRGQAELRFVEKQAGQLLGIATPQVFGRDPIKGLCFGTASAGQRKQTEEQQVKYGPNPGAGVWIAAKDLQQKMHVQRHVK